MYRLLHLIYHCSRFVNLTIFKGQENIFGPFSPEWDRRGKEGHGERNTDGSGDQREFQAGVDRHPGELPSGKAGSPTRAWNRRLSKDLSAPFGLNDRGQRRSFQFQEEVVAAGPAHNPSCQALPSSKIGWVFPPTARGRLTGRPLLSSPAQRYTDTCRRVNRDLLSGQRRKAWMTVGIAA